MKSSEIRSTFFDFFKSKGHTIVPSAPMVVKNDPTLMFTNAGMNQFKDLFLGLAKAKNTRVADTQKCLRVSGKHNDLEEVGVDTYHHTMFEMIGNWSFGDYFKKEAIEWAWELLTEVYKIDKSRLYVTIFEGDTEDGLEMDTEARNYWKNLISEDRIIACNKKDNFWEMGETGPCGPCSEIHVDIRNESDRAKIDGKSLVNNDHPQVVEIWNLVFIQFNRMFDRSLQTLPNKHIDTGMGLERLAMVLQGKQSNYDSDIFQPIIKKICALSNKTYGATDSKHDIAIRVISDHVRAVAFSIADGQLPSNTGAGYVIRRILRRAIRYGYSFLDFKESFINELIPVLVAEMGGVFPELTSQKELIQKVIKEEEESFLRTLEKGITRFNDYAKKTTGKVEGKFAFELYDTFGFPIDLTQLMASEENLVVDMEAFEIELQQQKNRSRAAGKVEAGDWTILIDDEIEEFIGYDILETTVKITKYRKVLAKGKEQFQLVFNITPFYAEGGGQVGDTGVIEENGNKTFVIDTKKENGQIIHFVKELPSNLLANFTAKINTSKRKLTEANHSATHLLHEALRTILGTHIEQKGSLVNAEYLRFDFSHFQKLTDKEIEEVENLVNQKIRANYSLNEQRAIPIEDAKKMGAMALFGEKYGDLVRVIQFGESTELCGGCHVQATGNIGLFKIKAEGAVAAGVRRIEAITATTAIDFVNSQVDLVKELSNLLKSQDLKKSVTDLLANNNKLQKEVESLNKKQASGLVDELISKVKNINGVNFLAQKVDLEDANLVKDLAFQLEQKIENALIVLGANMKGKANLTVMVSKNLTETKNLHAGTIIRELSKEIQGGGGGQANFASAGGKNPAGIESALTKAESYL